MSNKENPLPPPYTPYPGEPTLNYPNHEQIQVRPGWGHLPPPPPIYEYGATRSTFPPNVITVDIPPTTPNQPTQIFLLRNACPNCRNGVIVDTYDCFALFLAIFFFPIGVLCCLAMREKRCTNCQSQF